MDQEARDALMGLAQSLLDETQDDEEPWSFVYRTPGALGGTWYAWERTDDVVAEDWVFDDLVGRWPPDRLEQVRTGEQEPTDEEWHQIREAMCRLLANNAEVGNVFWITPIDSPGGHSGYVLFRDSVNDDPEVPPMVDGVFESQEDALQYLRALGAIGGETDWTYRRR